MIQLKETYILVGHIVKFEIFEEKGLQVGDPINSRSIRVGLSTGKSLTFEYSNSNSNSNSNSDEDSDSWEGFHDDVAELLIACEKYEQERIEICDSRND